MQPRSSQEICENLESLMSNVEIGVHQQSGLERSSAVHEGRGVQIRESPKPQVNIVLSSLRFFTAYFMFLGRDIYDAKRHINMREWSPKKPVNGAGLLQLQLFC